MRTIFVITMLLLLPYSVFVSGNSSISSGIDSNSDDPGTFSVATQEVLNHIPRLYSPMTVPDGEGNLLVYGTMDSEYEQDGVTYPIGSATILKLDVKGDVVWQHVIGIGTIEDLKNSNNNRIIISGWVQSVLEIKDQHFERFADDDSTEKHFFILNLDTNGNFQWSFSGERHHSYDGTLELSHTGTVYAMIPVREGATIASTTFSERSLAILEINGDGSLSNVINLNQPHASPNHFILMDSLDLIIYKLNDFFSIDISNGQITELQFLNTLIVADIEEGKPGELLILGMHSNSPPSFLQQTISNTVNKQIYIGIYSFVTESWVDGFRTFGGENAYPYQHEELVYSENGQILLYGTNSCPCGDFRLYTKGGAGGFYHMGTFNSGDDMLGIWNYSGTRLAFGYELFPFTDRTSMGPDIRFFDLNGSIGMTARFSSYNGIEAYSPSNGDLGIGVLYGVLHDDDLDGVSNYNDDCMSEFYRNQGFTTGDYDRDGCWDDQEDLDDDNDGYVDTQDSCTNSLIEASTDGNDYDEDGCFDLEDSDDDGDYIYDDSDLCQFGAIGWISNKSNDNDRDGCKDDTEDDDDDNDGVIDVIDDCKLRENGHRDIDSDGLCEGDDLDDDGDNYSDSDETECGSNLSDFNDLPADNDQDMICDELDEDIDGDNVTNSDDVFPYNRDEWNDLDQDGIGNNSDDCVGTYGTSTVDRLGCLDQDGDGVSDLNDLDPYDAEIGLDEYDGPRLDIDEENETNLSTDQTDMASESDGVVVYSVIGVFIVAGIIIFVRSRRSSLDEDEEEYGEADEFYRNVTTTPVTSSDEPSSQNIPDFSLSGSQHESGYEVLEYPEGSEQWWWKDTENQCWVMWE